MMSTFRYPKPTTPYPDIAVLHDQLRGYIPNAPRKKSCEQRAIELDKANFDWPGRYALATFQRAAESQLTEEMGYIAGWAHELFRDEASVRKSFNDDRIALEEMLRRELRKRIHRYTGRTRGGKPVSVVRLFRKYVTLDVLRVAPQEPKLSGDTGRTLDELGAGEDAVAQLGWTKPVGNVDLRPGREPAPERSVAHREALAVLMRHPPRSELLFKVAARYRVALDRLDLAAYDEPGIAFAVSSGWRDGGERLHPLSTLAGPLPAGARGARKAEWLKLQELQRQFLARMQELIIAEFRAEQALGELIRHGDFCILLERAAGRPILLPPTAKDREAA